MPRLVAARAGQRLSLAVVATAAVAGWLVAAPAASAHLDEVPVSELDSAWALPPAVLVPAGLALALFAQAFVRLRLRGRSDHARPWRAVVFVVGVGAAVLALVSPLDAVSEEYLLSAHMLQHVVVGDAAIALILAAIGGPLLFFLLPAPLLRPVARLRPLRAALSFLATPAVALLVWAAVLAVWHVPALYQAALRTQWVHDVEHASFVLAGLLMWYQLLDPARQGHLSRSGRLGLIVVLFVAGQMLTAVLLFTGEPLYAEYALQDERLLGLSPLTDQRLAGAVMMAEQAAALGTLGALVLLGAAREGRADTAMPAGRGT